jgi:signal peptidase II
LVLADQAVKIIIAEFFMEPHICVHLIEGVLFICAVQNIHLGWIPNMLDYMMPLYMAVLITIIGMQIMVVWYRFSAFCASGWHKYKNLPVIMLTVLLSAAFCKLIDDIFWGGSIDYIRLFDWFTFDLKDIYANFALALVIFYLIIFYANYYKLSKEKRKEYEKKIKFFKWLKMGLPLEYKEEQI